jgi:DNA polymerase
VTSEDRAAALEAIASEVRACTRCRLAQGRTRAVPGEGSPDTEVVFVGEGPGQNEDRQGRPFVGAAGTLLQELLGMIGWRREDVFITNVVKCRPPNNRDPEPDEIAACQPYLRRQLEILDPALLVTLGRFSLQTFMPGDRISRVHGTERPIDPATGARAATGYALYHPAAALRQGSLKETMQRDVARVPEVLIRARAGRAAAPVPEPQTTSPTPAEAPPTDPPTEPAKDEPVNRNDQYGLF